MASIKRSAVLETLRRWRPAIAFVAAYALTTGPIWALPAASAEPAPIGATSPVPSDPVAPPQPAPQGAALAPTDAAAPEPWTGPSLAQVLADPAVRQLDMDLRAQGFVIAPVLLDQASQDNGYVVVLGIDDGGLKNPVPGEDPMWRDAARLYVSVLWSAGAAIATIETRLSRDAAWRPCFLHEARLVSDSSTRLRAVDTVGDTDVVRSVHYMVRDQSGAFVPSEQGPVTDLNWPCVRNCFAAAGASITRWAAICLVVCLTAAGLAALVSGGSAFLPVLVACARSCARAALRAVGLQLLNCIRTC